MLITAADGGIVNDPVLLRIEQDRWWLALADSDAGLYAMGVAVNSGLDVHVGHPEVYPVQVQGPKAKDVMRDLFGGWVLDMKYYWCDEADLDGIPVVISRTGWTAVVGYEIYLRDPSRGDDLWERILDAGKPYGIRVTPSSDIRRMEAGIFDYGSDFGLETNPFEVTGLERLVEPQDADYVGKEALERIRREGVTRKLVGIELDGDPVEQPTQHWPAFGGRRAGRARDGRVLVAAPGEEHRLRLGADRARGAGQPAGDPRRRQRAHRSDGADPLHRPEEEGPVRLRNSVSVGLGTVHR